MKNRVFLSTLLILMSSLMLFNMEASAAGSSNKEARSAAREACKAKGIKKNPELRKCIKEELQKQKP